jgi:hypothetical protein
MSGGLLLSLPFSAPPMLVGEVPASPAWLRAIGATGEAAASACSARASSSPRPPNVAFCFAGSARSFATPLMLTQHYQHFVRPLAGSSIEQQRSSRAFMYLKIDDSDTRRPQPPGTFHVQGGSFKHEQIELAPVVAALESGWVRRMLAEAVIINGSGAYSGEGWRAEDATSSASSAIRQPDPDLFVSGLPNSTFCSGPTSPSGVHIALGLAWCAGAISRQEKRTGIDFTLVAVTRPDQLFLWPMVPWCQWSFTETTIACQASGTDGVWVAPRAHATQLLAMRQVYVNCGRDGGDAGYYQCMTMQHGATVPVNCGHASFPPKLRGRRLGAALSPACCGVNNEHAFAQVLHRPRPLPLYSKSCAVLSSYSFTFLRSGVASCDAAINSAYMPHNPHLWAKRFVREEGSVVARLPERAGLALRSLFAGRPMRTLDEQQRPLGAHAMKECHAALEPIAGSAEWERLWHLQQRARAAPADLPAHAAPILAERGIELGDVRPSAEGRGRRASEAPSIHPPPDASPGTAADSSPLNSMLSVTIDVARLRANGTLAIPAGTREILIEVGANTRNTADVELLPARPHAFLITFEPILDKYGTLLSRNSHADRKSPLGHHHKRGLVLPIAVSADEGHATFHMDGDIDGCASLLPASRVRSFKGCATPDAASREERKVPTVSLRTVLGKWLAWEGGGGWPVAYLKVDAQGYDLQVVESAGELLDRVEQLEIEVVRDSCGAMYVGAPNCSAAVAYMARRGYTKVNKNCATARFPGAKVRGRDRVGCEDNFVFARPTRLGATAQERAP